MSNDHNTSNSRSEQRSKRKKTNLILNSLIVIVIILIGIVSYSIFFTGNDETSQPKKEQATTKQDAEEANTTVDDTEEETTTDEPADTNTEDEDDLVITEGGSDANVIKTYENTAWKPIGTSQTGEHVTTYDSNSQDWQEMLQAISYATGLEESNMTVIFIGNNNDPQKAVGTVTSKDKTEKYRAYIEWVDEEGWKPTKVEEINDVNVR